jgi:molecular chaperone GrpE
MNEENENGEKCQDGSVEQSAAATTPASPVSDIEGRLAKAEADAAGYFAQLQRTTADFDNYRKRMIKEREEFVKAASERIILEILEPVENLDRALDASKSAKSIKKLREGVQMTREQIWSVLERNGLRRLDTVGCKFDSRWHEVVERVCDGAADEGTIKEEVRSGYTLNGKVLRCAKVKVSTKMAVENQG